MNRLKEIRTQRKTKTIDLVNYLDISMQYYYDLEKGERRLNEDLLIKIADYYKVTIDYILMRTDDPNIVIYEKQMLPEELRGIVESVESLKDLGADYSGIKEILDFHRKLMGNK